MVCVSRARGTGRGETGTAEGSYKRVTRGMPAESALVDGRAKLTRRRAPSPCLKMILRSDSQTSVSIASAACKLFTRTVQVVRRRAVCSRR